MSFADDYEKMIDLFVLSREEFLKFYGYLSEEDYTETVHDIISKSGYWHKEWYEDNPDMDGRALKNIVFGMMAVDWLNKKEN